MTPDRTFLEADYAVVGLGAMGASTLHFLAHGGGSVIGIDRFAPPQRHGASHGGHKAARHAGAQILENAAVTRITPVAGGVEIEADGLRIRAGRVVVAAGRWTGLLFGGQFGNLLSVTPQRTFTFKALDAAAYRPSRFPT